MKKAIVYIVGLTVLLVRPVAAAVHTVTSAADDGGAGTLRYIVETASAAGDTVQFAPGVNLITLNGTEITIAKKLAIDGGGQVSLDGGGVSRIFHVNIEARTEVAFTGLAFSNGFSSGNGGAILVDKASSVAFTNCQFTACRAANGGAIYNVEPITLSECIMTGNSATGAGGALCNNTGWPLVIVGGWYSENLADRGGAISADHWSGPDLAMTGGTVISNNIAKSDGGGMLWWSARGFMRGASFVDNGSGGGGGGLTGGTKAGATCIIEDSLFLRNGTRFAGGGAALSNGKWVMLNTTFRENWTTNAENWRAGGGVMLRSSIGAFTNCTFVMNGSRAGNGFGGGVFTHAAYPERTITYFTDCNFVGNNSGGADGTGGGALLVDDSYVVRCNFTTNSAGTSGGALHVKGGNVVVHDSSFNSNSVVKGGGAIRCGEGALTSVGNVFRGNYSTSSLNWAEHGGAMFVSGPQDVVVSNCLFVANRESNADGGAVASSTSTGRLTFHSSQFEGNTGPNGGALGLQVPTGIYSCTFISNSATAEGGAIIMYAANNNATSTVANCTFYGNSASVRGSAICGWMRYAGSGVPNWQPAIAVHNSTFSGNAGKAAIQIYRNTDQPRYSSVYSSLFWANFEGEAANDLEGDFVDVEFSMVNEPENNGYSTAGSTAGTVHGVDPKLEPLAYNGGPMLYEDAPLLTMALRRRSPAIDAGANLLAMAYDQRGLGFPREMETGLPDIGAFEYIPPPPMNTIITIK